MTEERWTHPLIPRLRTHANEVEARHLPETADLLRAAAEEMEGGAEVLQAVLDAIKGTLDPSTQIADHPNVKFAQMQRLNWMEVLAALKALSAAGLAGKQAWAAIAKAEGR